MVSLQRISAIVYREFGPKGVAPLFDVSEIYPAPREISEGAREDQYNPEIDEVIDTLVGTKLEEADEKDDVEEEPQEPVEHLVRVRLVFSNQTFSFFAALLLV